MLRHTYVIRIILSITLMVTVGVSSAVAESTSDKTKASNKAKNKERLSLSSPDKTNTIQFEINNEGVLLYSVSRESQPVIQPSRLGFNLRDQKPLNVFRLTSSKRQSRNTTWEAVWGENKHIVDHHNELLLELRDTESKRKLNIRARAFNDGVAFRYEFPKQKHLSKFIISDELTQFNVAMNPETWWIEADYNTYEKLYQHTPLDKIDHVHTPLTMRAPSGLHVSIHEAALTNYASMSLKRGAGTQLTAELAPWANGDKVRTSAPSVSPWRTIQLSDDARGLISSNMVLNLNEPNALTDTSWIKPMVYMGIWWEIHIGLGTWTVGDRHAATTERAMEYIDFAAENNIGGLLIEGWNKGWDKWGERDAYLVPAHDFDLIKVAHYAKQKGVRLVGHNETGGNAEAYQHHVDDVFDIYRALGIQTVKTGYVAEGGLSNGENHHGQWAVNHYRRIVKLAAHYNIMLNVHEPVKDTGIRRTYPHMMTREGARGLEYNAWSEGNPPNHTLVLPFTRLLAGPMDYTGGIVDLDFSNFEGKRYDWWGNKQTRDYRVHSTLARQLADMIILYSPLQMAADVVENYRGHEAMSFIRRLDMDFDTSIVLEAKVGEALTIARRSGDTWFVGASTNEQARELKLVFDFLPAGKTYEAHIYRDADNAHWKTAPEEWVKESKNLSSKSSLKISLAPGGGAALILSPVTESKR